MTIETAINMLTLSEEMEGRGQKAQILQNKAWEIIDDTISKEQDERRKTLSTPLKANTTLPCSGFTSHN
jgi:hypothetical protein